MLLTYLFCLAKNDFPMKKPKMLREQHLVSPIWLDSLDCINQFFGRGRLALAFRTRGPQFEKNKTNTVL